MLAMVCLSINAQEEHAHHHQTDTISKMDHSMHQNTHQHSTSLEAPISVMGSHMHEKGSWMFSYRFMNMNMNGLRQGTNDISNADGYAAGYLAIPLKMQMQMHMLGVMYAPTDKLTLMAMANVVTNDMGMQMLNMSTGMPMSFSTASSSFGDLKISGLYQFFNKNQQTIHGHLGVSIPTGSINAKDVTPMSMGNEVILPYSMQIGSGTLDTKLGVTYLGHSKSLSWGHQLLGTFRLGKNDNEYRLGNKYSFNNWLSVKTTDWLSFSGRLEGVIVDEISGVNPDLNPMMVLTADTQNSGGTYINSAIGFNLYAPKGSFENLVVGFEIGYPIYQKVNGVQLKQKESITFGLQYSL